MRLFLEGVHNDHGQLHRFRALSVIKALHDTWHALHPAYHGMLQYLLPRRLWSIRFPHGSLFNEKGRTWNEFFHKHVRNRKEPPWELFRAKGGELSGLVLVAVLIHWQQES